MCGRFTLKTSTETMAALFDELRFPNLRPRYNICPTQPILCVRQSSEGQEEAVQLRWGLVPFWAKDLKIGAKMINARSETAATKPSFRSAFKKRRCLILADGFYEWKKEGKLKQPYYISRRDEAPFCLAGLWESWQDKSLDNPEAVETCTILTTDANEIMQPLHDRMPVFVDHNEYDFWLDKDFSDVEQLQKLMVPLASNDLQVFPVDKMVNKPVNDSPQCIEPVKGQQSFFE